MILADGASIHTVKWIQGLSLRQDWDLFLVSMNPAEFHPDIAKIEGLQGLFHCAPERIYESGNNFHYAFQVPKVRRMRNQIQPDVINSVYLTSYGVVGALIKGNAKLCHFIIGDDVMVTPDRSMIFNQLTSFALRRADFIISASQTMSEKIMKKWNIPSEKILTQQYGVSDWVLEYAPKEKLYDFVSSRMWVPNSNIDWMLSTLESLPQKFRLALVGDVVKGSEELGERINSLSSRIPGVCRLGVLSHEKNIEVMAQSEFLFSVTSSDGASLSLMEAMALGAIPIVSDTAPNREWVQHLENGFLLPLNDRERALDIIVQALASSESKRREMRRINQGIIQSRGSLKENMNRVLNCLDWPLSRQMAVR